MIQFDHFNTINIADMTSTNPPTPPISKDELRKAILDIFLLSVRTTSLWTTSRYSQQVDASLPPADLWDPEAAAEDFDFKYEQIAESTIAQVLDYQYDYAFLGLEGLDYEHMEVGTTHTWVAAYLVDLLDSHVISEWASFGAIGGDRSSVQLCLSVCELANARKTLMTGEGFFSFFYYADRASQKKGMPATSNGGLTVRQVALLSGIEETTIRAMISRKNAGALVPHKEDGRTLFKPEVVREWLQSKGKLLPITYGRPGDELNLSTVDFKSLNAFIEACSLRLFTLERKHGDSKAISQKVKLLLGKDVAELSLNMQMLRDEPLMKELASLLESPPELFALRAQQVALLEELSATTQRIKRMTQGASA